MIDQERPPEDEDEAPEPIAKLSDYLFPGGDLNAGTKLPYDSTR